MNNRASREAELRPLGLTWPQLQQVMQGLDVPLEIHRVGKLLPQTVSLRCSPHPPSSPPGLLGRGEEDRAEAHCQVLVGHPVEGAEGRHQAEVVQQEGQRGLKGERTNSALQAELCAAQRSRLLLLVLVLVLELPHPLWGRQAGQQLHRPLGQLRIGAHGCCWWRLQDHGLPDHLIEAPRDELGRQLSQVVL